MKNDEIDSKSLNMWSQVQCKDMHSSISQNSSKITAGAEFLIKWKFTAAGRKHAILTTYHIKNKKKIESWSSV